MVARWTVKNVRAIPDGSIERSSQRSLPIFRATGCSPLVDRLERSHTFKSKDASRLQFTASLRLHRLARAAAVQPKEYTQCHKDVGNHKSAKEIYFVTCGGFGIWYPSLHIDQQDEIQH